MRSPETVIVGHVCVDQNKAEHTAYTSWGSSALYTADYFQKHFGCMPEVISTYGPDFLEYRESFHLHPEKPDARQTLVNENIMSGKDKERIRYSHHANEAGEPTLTPEVVKLVRKADILIVATLLPNYTPAYIKELAEYTSANCLKILIVQGYLRAVNEDGLISLRDFPEAAEILPNFDIAVLSDDDHPKAIELAKDWKQLAPKTDIIMTQGPQGASVVGVNTVRNIPTKPVPAVEIVDSVGCGDIFTAALAYHYFQSGDISGSIMAGHRAARRKLLATKSDIYEVPGA